MPATPSRRRPASQSQCVSWLLPRKWILHLRSRVGNRRVVPFVVGFFTDVLEPSYKQFCAWVETALPVASASGRMLKHPLQTEEVAEKGGNRLPYGRGSESARRFTATC